jgi:ubiquinone/menaquinone biosynthesis C-methylase UbiE
MAFSDPQHNVKQFGLHGGMSVADFGAGTGAYTIASAREVGGAGRVYAVEVQKELLQNIENAATDAGLSNVEVLWGDIERNGKTKIKDRTVDAVVAANVLFQVEDMNGTILEIKRILKPEGRVLVVDWKDSFGGMGPQAGDILTYEEARKSFEENGFSFLKNIEAGDHHYGFIVKK